MNTTVFEMLEQHRRFLKGKNSLHVIIALFLIYFFGVLIIYSVLVGHIQRLIGLISLVSVFTCWFFVLTRLNAEEVIKISEAEKIGHYSFLFALFLILLLLFYDIGLLALLLSLISVVIAELTIDTILDSPAHPSYESGNNNVFL